MSSLLVLPIMRKLSLVTSFMSSSQKLVPPSHTRPPLASWSLSRLLLMCTHRFLVRWSRLTKISPIRRVRLTSAYTDGWMMKVKMSTPAELDSLMDAAQYEAACDQ